MLAVCAWIGSAAGVDGRGPTAPADVFPGARFDAVETAALRAARLYRTSSAFDAVLNHYRFKRKQAVHVVEEDLGARLERLAHRTSGTVAEAWRALARRHRGQMQRIGEGQRVTIYHPWISERALAVIDETVIVLSGPGDSGRRTSGGVSQ